MTVAKLFPSHSVENGREKVIKVRVDDDELNILKEMARKTSKSLAAYVRETALGNPTVIVKNSQRWATLGVLGNEFIELKEDLQKYLNENSSSMPTIDIEKLIEQSEQIIQEIKALREDLV